jgi:3-oxoacyl-[acyl-carrier-protein] synthase II
VPNTPREREIDVVLSNSFGFGGTNASVILRRVTD